LAKRKLIPLTKILNSSFVDLPSPVNLSVNWNYGSILRLILINQLLTGIVLRTRFTADVSLRFGSVVRIVQDREYGWLLRLLHSTGASFFFLFLYLHIGRGIYYGSYTKTILWNIGVLIYLILIGTAFLGYVLPWGQISYWAATVITNLLSAIPVIGSKLVVWVWGGFAVANPTLTRFYSLHFLLPFVVRALVVLHIFYLHLYGRSNPLGISSDTYKVSFHYYFSVKDGFYVIVFILILTLGSCVLGYDFIDPENFIPANNLVTPTHIQPEWYFLFAYAILRAIPNKLGGVIALVLAVIVLFLFRINTKNLFFSRMGYRPIIRFIFWSLVRVFFLLTWLGACAPEYPYITLRCIFTALYFILFGFIFIKNVILIKQYLAN